MKWSKVKKLAESLLAESLRNRVRYHVTNYGAGLDTQDTSRGWLTLDGKELVNFSNAEYQFSRGSLLQQIESLNTGKEGTKAHPAVHAQVKQDHAEKLLAKQELFSEDQFYLSLEEYIQLPVEAALSSPNTIIRAIALLDRRCGKRRLETLKPPADAPNLVKECFRIRCEAEGLHLPA